MAVPTSDLDLFADEVLLDPYPHLRRRSASSAAVVHLPDERRLRPDPLRRHPRRARRPGDVLVRRRSASTRWSTRRCRAPRWPPTRRSTPSSARRSPQNLTPRALRGLKAQIDEKADSPRRRARRAAARFEAIDALARALPDRGRRRPHRLHRTRHGQHAALGPGRDAGHRPAEPAHAGELPDRRRALRLVLAVTAEDLAPGSVGPRHLRRRGARRHPRRARPGTSSTSTSGPASTRPSPRSATSSPCSRHHPDQFDLVREGPRPRAGRLRRGAPLLGARSTPGAARSPRDVEIDGATRPGRRPGRDPLRRRQPRPAPLREPRRLPASSATRSTTSPSATARTAAPARGWPGSRRTRHRGARHAGSSGSSSARRSASRATSPGASSALPVLEVVPA